MLPKRNFCAKKRAQKTFMKLTPDKFSILYPDPVGGFSTPILYTIMCCQILNFESNQNLGKNILGPLELKHLRLELSPGPGLIHVYKIIL